MAKVFISHSWEDNEIARKTAYYLKRDGAEIWIDYARIKGGEALPSRISEALEWCDTLVLVWSKSAAESYYVNLEWQAALDMKKKVVICLIENTQRPAILRGFLYIDSKNFSKGYEQLLRALDLEGLKPPPPPETLKPAHPKIKIPTQKILKIAAIFLAIVMLGFTANYVVQKFAAAREADWEKRQSEMNTRFQQAQQINGDANKLARDKAKIWQQLLTDFSADNPYSQQDNNQKKEAAQQRDSWNHQAKQDSVEALWILWQMEMNSSYEQASHRDNLSSLTPADKARMWEDFLTQYTQDNPFSQKDNEQLANATRRKDFWHNQAERESEQAIWEQRQLAMNKSYNEAKQRDQNRSLSPDSKAQAWQNFLTSYAEDNPFSQQDNEQRKYANDRETYLTNLDVKSVSKTKEKTVKGMMLVLIPGGTFEMGDTFGDGDADEKPVHSVTVSDFYMGKTEVTVGQFRKFVEETGYQTDAEKQGWSYAWTGSSLDKVNGASWRKPGLTQTDDHPVVDVSWNDANEFCKWAGCRLPTEAEWEYAARNKGQAVKYSWGNAKPIGRKGGNVADESAKKKFSDWTIFEGYDDGYIFTSPVASYDANGLGLFDMTGNVWEWCSDWYAEDYYKNSPRNNPKGPSSGIARFLRGGSWNFYVRLCRSSSRLRYLPVSRNDCIGFRVVRDSPL